MRARSRLEVPDENIRIEQVPVRTLEHARADLGLWLDQTLGSERLQRLAQHGSGYAESFQQFRIAGQNTVFGIGAAYYLEPEIAHDMAMMRARLPRRAKIIIGELVA